MVLRQYAPPIRDLKSPRSWGGGDGTCADKQCLEKRKPVFQFIVMGNVRDFLPIRSKTTRTSLQSRKYLGCSIIAFKETVSDFYNSFYGFNL